MGIPLRPPPGKMFCIEMTKVMITRHMNATEIANRLAHRGINISRQFIGMLANGRRQPSIARIQQVSEVMHLRKEERERLYRAAALDAGYEIGAVL